jgi:hypothetical protein
MSRRRRVSREKIAADRARKRRDEGDPRPYMVILAKERDRLGIVPPLERSRSVITVKTGELL